MGKSFSPISCGLRSHYVPSTLSCPFHTRHCRGNKVENNLLSKGLLRIILHPRPCMMGRARRETRAWRKQAGCLLQMMHSPKLVNMPYSGLTKEKSELSLGRQRGAATVRMSMEGVEDTKRPVRAGPSSHAKCALVIIVQVQK